MPFSDNKNNSSQSINRHHISMDNTLSHKALYACLSRNIKNYELPQVRIASFFHDLKRVTSFAFRQSAFISIEAAISLSLFTLAVMCFLSFGTVMNQRMKMEVALRNTASKIAQDYVIYDAVATGESSLIEDFAIRGIGTIAARQLLLEELGKDSLDKSCVYDGASGISFLYSEILDDEEYVDLVISYKMKLPFKIIPLPDIKMTQRSRIYPWTGVPVFEDDEYIKEYVYLTKTGTVYHKALSCKHLNIQILKLNISELNSVRNDSGGKYYPCQICHEEDETIIYITKSGTAYHGDKDCPTVSRDVRKVAKEDCIGIPACKSCGG